MNGHEQTFSERGYTLVEIAIGLTLMTVLGAIATPMLTTSIRSSDADAAAQLIAQELGYARALAVGSHANVQVQVLEGSNYLVAANGSGSARGPFSLPGRMQFLSSGVSPDTPDALGSVVLGAGSRRSMTFLDSGAVVGDPLVNDLISGTFFIQHPNGDPGTRRAVTLMGGTGRIHIWRYDKRTYTWK